MLYVIVSFQVFADTVAHFDFHRRNFCNGFFQFLVGNCVLAEYHCDLGLMRYSRDTTENMNIMCDIQFETICERGSSLQSL